MTETLNDTSNIFYPKEALDRKYNAGYFNSLHDQLIRFVKVSKEAILEEANVQQEAVDPQLEALRLIITKRKSINLASEMADQIKEISKEIWYRGEEGETDIQQIKETWTVNHAASWRQARVTEILYLIDKEAKSLKALLS